MKHILLVLISFISIASLAQDTLPHNNHISIGIISPYEVDGMAGMDGLINDDGIIPFNYYEVNNRSYQKFGAQLKYYRSLGKCQLGLRLGMTSREIDEHKQNITYDDYNDPLNVLIDQVSDYRFEYSQKNYTAGIGIREQAILGRLLISGEILGVVSRIGPSKQVYRQTTHYYNSDGFPIPEHNHYNYYWDVDPGWMLGPGGEISAGIVLLKRISISASIGMYFLYTHVDGEITYTEEYVKDDYITHVMLEDSYEKEVHTLQTDQSSWSFSRPALGLEVGVSF